MNIKRILSFLILALFIKAYGQDSKAFKKIFLDAEYYYITENFQTAQRHYEDLLRMDPQNSNLQYLYGSCCLKISGCKDQATSYLEKAIHNVNPSYKEGSYKERQAPPEAFFLLARAHHIDNDFDTAIEYYAKYRDLKPKMKFADTEYVNAQIKSCELGMSMINNPADVRFSSVGEAINLNNISYNPVISGNDSLMIFSVQKPSRMFIMMSTKQMDRWSEPRSLNNELGLTGNFYPVSLSYDGTELYLVQQDYYETDIFVSHFSNNKWSRIIRLNKNINTRYLESHACVSRDGQTLYFTSDRPGGQGALDIYTSERESGDNWGKATNLGPTVNSYYNEDTPFLTRNDTKLYFSSQGHATMGGYDIFYTEKTENGSWSVPENIGYPLNTADDDLFYNPGWNDQLGYYSFTNDSISGSRNIYSVRIFPAEDLTIGIRKKGEPQMERVTEPVKSSASITSSLGIYYILNNILFDFNDHTLDPAAIREVERVYTLMRKYPEIGIELTGHTDAKGSAEYNLQLATKRAESVADYLTGAGISKDRIKVHAAGETDPVAINRYEDGTDAPEGRKLNRHVSIKINNLQHGKIRVAEIFVPDYLMPRADQTFSILLAESKNLIDTMPGEFLNEPVSRITTDSSHLYSAGNFDRKTDAVKYLNDAIDHGYDQAQLMEKEMLEQLIREKSKGDRYEPLTFTIQIMALKKPVDISYFRDMENVRKYIGKDGFHRYVCGEYNGIDKALKELPLIHRKGYQDAFVMTLNRYERISIK